MNELEALRNLLIYAHREAAAGGRTYVEKLLALAISDLEGRDTPAESSCRILDDPSSLDRRSGCLH